MSDSKGRVMTVRGPIPAGELGVTQTHEHIWLNAYEHYKNYQFVLEHEGTMVAELGEFTSRGGKSIVEVTTAEIGRDPVALKTISERSGVNIVMGSGWYREFAYPPEVREKTSRELADDLIREIEHGVGDTGIRPGIIGEIGTGVGRILPAEERVFRAAALAQQATGLAITTHTTRWGTLALEQIAMLKEFGADLSRVIIGHLGDRIGVENLLPIASHGVYVEVDNIGYRDYQPEWVRADNVAALVKEGFARQILLSQDICLLSHLKYQGGNGYGYLLEHFLPLLRERGVSEEAIHLMLVENPARLLAVSTPVCHLPPGIVNAVGYATRVGGSRPSPRVLQVMQRAQECYFEIDDLLEQASKAIARATGSEAGIVTCGAGAGLTLGAAAILAGDDLEIMEALPDTSRLPRRTFLYPERNDFDYDHPVRASGARLEFFDFDGGNLEERLRRACAGEVAGVVYVWKHCADNGAIRRVAAVCRETGTPLLLDGAMCLPPAENLREIAALGANLVTISGGKHLEGPQNSGLLFGDAALVRSAWLQMTDLHVRPGSWSMGHLLKEGLLPRPPRHGIGRGFKVGKDAILGCLAALELYPSRDFAAERKRWHAICRTIAGALGNRSSFEVQYLPENGTGQYPVVKITAPGVDPMNRLQEGLKNQTPKIILAEDDEDAAVAYVYPICLDDAEVGILIERMTSLFQHED